MMRTIGGRGGQPRSFGFLEDTGLVFRRGVLLTDFRFRFQLDSNPYGPFGVPRLEEQLIFGDFFRLVTSEVFIREKLSLV
jgi:hypothetical protein